jgi:hypothetical protein
MRMVNVGFPERTGMVSKWWIRRMHDSMAKAGINRKFTPNQINRIFRGFSAN